MPVIKDNGDGTFIWQNDTPWRNLPENVNVVRTDNPPPAAVSMGRPDLTMSPVWPVKIETADTYQLSPSARADLYRTPTYYDTVRAAPEGQGGIAGTYTGNPLQRNLRYWTGLSASNMPMEVSNFYRTGENGASLVIGAPQTLVHEYTHKRQEEDPLTARGMQQQSWTPWYEQGWREYGPSTRQQAMTYLPAPIDLSTRESHATLAEQPWQFTQAERERFYPGMFQADATWR